MESWSFTYGLRWADDGGKLEHMGWKSYSLTYGRWTEPWNNAYGDMVPRCRWRNRQGNQLQLVSSLGSFYIELGLRHWNSHFQSINEPIILLNRTDGVVFHHAWTMTATSTLPLHLSPGRQIVVRGLFMSQRSCSSISRYKIEDIKPEIANGQPWLSVSQYADYQLCPPRDLIYEKVSTSAPLFTFAMNRSWKVNRFFLKSFSRPYKNRWPGVSNVVSENNISFRSTQR